MLCVHWLTDGGAHKQRLWDIYYAVHNRGSDFDWDRFLSLVDVRRRRWLACTLGLAQRFLGLDLDDTPIKDEAADLPAWLVDTVEKEWASEDRLWPLDASLGDMKLFVRQFRKRFHPNPIWATVHMNGSFDAKTRLFYQLGSWFKRIGPSIRRVSRAAYVMKTK